MDLHSVRCLGQQDGLPQVLGGRSRLYRISQGHRHVLGDVQGAAVGRAPGGLRAGPGRGRRQLVLPLADLVARRLHGRRERQGHAGFSPETRQALEYGKKLYATFISGTTAWLDPSNNKAFLAGDVSVVSNGISIYYAAKTSEDAAMQELAKDIYHAPTPIGPVGSPSDAALSVNAMVFNHTKYPNAAKEYIRFMMEKDQYEPWQQASIGYWSQSLNAYDGNPVWTEDPKHTPYANIMGNSLPYGYKGPLGYASAGALADYIVVTMVSSAISGSSSIDDAIAEATRRAGRYYR